MSNTFHGRDIFAPAAAYLSKGTPLAEFGPRVAGIASSSFAGVIGKKDGLHGEVVHVDDFGNIVTNFEVKDLKRANIGGSMMVRVGSLRLLLKRGKTYGDVEEQKPLAVVGSHGFLEISVNQGNAAKTFRVGAGDHVVLSRP